MILSQTIALVAFGAGLYSVFVWAVRCNAPVPATIFMLIACPVLLWGTVLTQAGTVPLVWPPIVMGTILALVCMYVCVKHWPELPQDKWFTTKRWAAAVYSGYTIIGLVLCWYVPATDNSPALTAAYVAAEPVLLSGLSYVCVPVIWHAIKPMK